MRTGEFELLHRPDLVEKDDAVARIRAGLSVVAQHDERRYARMQRDMNILLVVVGPGMEVFADLGVGTLNERWLLQASPTELALMLVEMAARARIGRRRAGRFLDVSYRRRIWHRSTLEQLSFASKLPDSASAVLDPLLEHLNQKLQAYRQPEKTPIQ